MGHSNAGVVLRSGAETTLRYLEAKRKNRKTLTLKKSPRNQNHFEANTDFTSSGVLKKALAECDVPVDSPLNNVFPILTSAVVLPTAAVAAVQGVPMGTIPVLDNPLATANNATFNINRINRRWVAALLLAVLALGWLLSGGMNQQQDVIETLSTTNNDISKNDINGIVAKSALNPDNNTQLATNATEATGPTNTTAVSKKNNIALVQNIVELIQKEEFSRDTTLQALLSLWQDVNASTRATLNSTPWFLRFVFTLQKRTRQYLQSPDSYHADYSIKFNELLNLSVALGVMSQQGIESSVETYHSRQTELVEQLKLEIASIEKTSKKQSPTNESIASFSKSFREQYDLKPVTVEMKQQKAIRHEEQINQVSLTTEPLPANEGITESISKNITAVELESLVTRFIAAYEHGDLNILMSLFSPDAKTNDKSGWHGIRQDYEKLFAASSFRLLNVIDMHWSSIHDSMKGIGDYEIAIAMDDAGNARTLHGKIQFVVSQVDNKLSITHLYHLER